MVKWEASEHPLRVRPGFPAGRYFHQYLSIKFR